MRIVRTTIEPDHDILVDEAGYADLKGQGLLLPGHDGEPYAGPVPDPKRQRAGTNERTEA